MLQWLARLFSLLTGAAARAEADRPWVQAITQPEVLDWKQGLTLGECVRACGRAGGRSSMLTGTHRLRTLGQTR